MVCLLLNSLYLGLHSREVEWFSSDTFKDVQYIIACCFKVSSGIITLRYKYLCMCVCALGSYIVRVHTVEPLIMDCPS